jgi:ribosomal subunit interface protein
MQTSVSILHHDYPPLVRDTVDAKLQQLERFHGRIVSMRALLERQRTDHRVELVANVGHGAVLVADARRDEFGAALEEATARMERLLKRDHDRRIERRRS